MKRGYDSTNIEYDRLPRKQVALVERALQPGGITPVSSYAIARKNPTDLVELAMEIQKADNFVYANACNKLEVIAEQMRFLQEQARKVLLEANTNKELHHIACNFVKVSGNTYHLYQKSSGQRYFGMLAPEEWATCPHQYLGSYRLEHDQSWTPVENIKERDKQFALINKVLVANERSNILHALQDVPMES